MSKTTKTNKTKTLKTYSIRDIHDIHDIHDKSPKDINRIRVLVFSIMHDRWVEGYSFNWYLEDEKIEKRWLLDGECVSYPWEAVSHWTELPEIPKIKNYEDLKKQVEAKIASER